ncbi:hypothetical protein M408DRAFT_224327 [Serendipita vermifera MAFF 305830]|uniref:Uncharacterized protein n=1 Tax=Serendipita vermifera MAFF 305830 TaxID=933852 RepID=A0A0C2W8Z5_SERVB|nr:hypothetical protein M408DRAFT_277744 [Serendipita vermifera MAFF 305830]KIM24934.1 hypothetical protein M408DRAFT_224327 [Serendipita vermifera MAFF 305830]
MDRILGSTKKSTSGGLGKMFTTFISSWTSQPQSAVDFPLFQDDSAFVDSLKRLEEDEPYFQRAIDEIKIEVAELLGCKAKKLSDSLLATLTEGQQTALEEDVQTLLKERWQKEEVKAWKDLRKQLDQYLLSSVPNQNGTIITINSVIREGTRIPDQPETFSVTGTRSGPHEAGFEYTIFPIEIKQDDLLAVSNNLDHICKPVVRPQHPQPISIPVNSYLRFIHLLENDLVLVIIEEPDVFMVYAEGIEFLSSVIVQRRAIRRFHSEKLGVNPLFAFDCTKGLLVIFSIKESSVQLDVYSFDTATRSFNARGGPEVLTRWYNQVPDVIHLLFVSGTEELLLVEKGGLCRIFSLVTANFRLVGSGQHSRRC